MTLTERLSICDFWLSVVVAGVGGWQDLSVPARPKKPWQSLPRARWSLKGFESSAYSPLASDRTDALPPLPV